MQKLVVTKKGVKVVKLSKKELEVRKQEETVQAAHREKTKYARLRQEEFIAREKKGDLPSTLHDHLDLIYKALEAAELNGISNRLS